jgi:hypothetical protein
VRLRAPKRSLVLIFETTGKDVNAFERNINGSEKLYFLFF